MTQQITDEQSKSAYIRLLKHAKNYWFYFSIGTACMVLAAMVDAAFTFLIGPLLDKGFINQDEVFIKWVPLVIIGLFVLRGLAGLLSNYFMSWVGRRVIMDFRRKLFNHYLYLPADFHDKHSSGKLLSTLIYNVEQVANASTTAVVTLVRESVLVISLILVMFINSWRLTLFFFIIMPIIYLIVKYTSKRLRKLGHVTQEAIGDVTHIAEEGIEGYKIVRLFGGQQYEINKFAEATNKNRQQEMKMVMTTGLSFFGMQILIAMVVALIIYTAVSGVFDSITAGAFTSLVAAMLAMIKPLKTLSNVNNEIQKGIAGADGIFKILDSELEEESGHLSLERAQGRIEYKDVTFTFSSKTEPVLTNINLSIEPGQTVALVGKSGSGKTTLASLLARFYHPQKGIVTLDGRDICDYQLCELRHQLSIVSQQVQLFNDTLANNISYGASPDKITRKEISRVAEAAHMMEFVKELPEDFDTQIGENGVLLSGGQRQRIAIARALFKNAPVLILDEATSALDSESEQEIQAALSNLIKNRTTLIIAHRLSTIKNADLILVMNKGEIIEQGTHESLLAQEGYYAKLSQLQFEI